MFWKDYLCLPFFTAVEAFAIVAGAAIGIGGTLACFVAGFAAARKTISVRKAENEQGIKPTYDT